MAHLHAHVQIEYSASTTPEQRDKECYPYPTHQIETLSGFDPDSTKDCAVLHAMLDEFISYLRRNKKENPAGWEGKEQNHFKVWDGMHV